MRYFDFIKEIKEISTSHILVNEYGEGDIYEYLNNGEHKYPCIFLTVTNLTTTDSGTAINFTLFYTDRLVENQANKTSIQSTGISVIKQILSKYEQLHPEYLLSNVNYTPFTEKFTDMCAGVFCDVVIENQIDTLEDYDNECEEGAFEVKTITLTKNGIYDIVGYDSAVVLVETDCHEYEELVDELTNTIEQKEVEIDSLEKEIVNVNSINELLNVEINSLNMTIEQKDIIIYEKDEQINSVTTLSITENGTYTPPTDVLGYNEITVNVTGGSSEIKRAKLMSIDVDDSCFDTNGYWSGGEVIDTSNITDMSDLFYNLSSLQSLDISGWNVSNVTNFEDMFRYCYNLKEVGNISNWNMNNATDLYGMFIYCSSLTQLDLTGWNVSNVMDIGNFSYESGIQNYVGGRTIDEVISNNITILNGLNVSGASIMSFYSDRASLRAFINGLADRTGLTSLNLGLGSNLKAKLTEEDIAVATAKNWTIS